MEKTKLIVDYKAVKSAIAIKRNRWVTDAEIATEGNTNRVSLCNYLDEAPNSIKLVVWMIKESGLTFEQIVKEIPIK